MSDTITLMGETIPVVAQPWNRLASGLGQYRDKLSGDTAVTIARLGTEAYEVLCVLAPEVGRRIPRYRWLGFASQAEMDEGGDYGELDGPTVPDVVEAYRVALRANGTDVLGGIGKLVDPRMLQALLSGAVEEAANSYYSTSRLPSGAPTSTSGSASSPPTARTNGASLSLASAPSSTGDA